MDVLTLLSTLLRRWRIVAAIMALTAVALVALVLRAEPTYEMRGSFLVTQPVVGDSSVEPDTGDEDDTGASSDGVPRGLSPVLIAEAAQDGDVVERVRGEGGTATYDVTVDGELLRVLATDSERATVVPTVEAVLGAIEAEVAALQAEAGIPEDHQAVVQRVSEPSDASVRGEVLSDDRIGYSASGTVRIVGVGVFGYNPYAESPFAVRILEEVLAGETARARIAEVGGTGDYSLDKEKRDDAPIVYLIARGSSPEETQDTFKAVRDAASEELRTRQAALGAPEGARIGLFDLSVPSEATALSAGLARPLITVAGLGGVAAVGLALLTDNLLQGWQRRQPEGRKGRKRNRVPAAGPEDAVVRTAAEPSDDPSPSEGSEADSEPETHEEPVDVPVAVNGNGSDSVDGNGSLLTGDSLSRQAREAMHLTVLDRVLSDASGGKPPVRELSPGTPSDLR